MMFQQPAITNFFKSPEKVKAEPVAPTRASGRKSAPRKGK